MEYNYKRQKPNQNALATLDNNLAYAHAGSAKKKNGPVGSSSYNRLSTFVGNGNVAGRSGNQRSSIIGPPRHSGASSLVPVHIARRETLVSRKPNSRISVYNQNPTAYNNNNTGNGNGNNIVNINISNSKDPRPLRDKKYQEQMRQDVMTYLNENNFEMETKHLLTEKTLRSPTQKDFVIIFNWLFKQIDPGHQRTKNFETDVVTLLKIVQYPYLDTINRSQISAVGGQSWYSFLGILHWLVKCSIFNQMAFDDDSKDLTLSRDETTPGEELNQMFSKYIKRSYQLFSIDKDNYETLKQDLNNEFEEYMVIVDESIAKLERNLNASQQLYDELIKDDELIENGNKRTEALENDIFKFKEYIRSIEARKIKWTANIEKMTKEVENLKQNRQDIELKNEEIIKKLSEKGLNLNDVKNLIEDHERATKEQEELTQLQEELEVTNRESLKLTQSKFEELEEAISKYNLEVNTIINGEDIRKQDSLRIKIADASKFADGKIEGLNVEDILTTKDNIEKRNLLKEMNKTVRDKIYKEGDELMKLQNSIDLSNEKINEKKKYLNTLEAKLSSVKLQSEEFYNNMQNESNASNNEMEKLENQLQLLQNSVDSSLLELDQKVKSKEIEYNTVVSEVKYKRETLHKQVENLINNIINFKMDFQENLESLDELVEGELKEGV